MLIGPIGSLVLWACWLVERSLAVVGLFAWTDEHRRIYISDSKEALGNFFLAQS